MKEPEKSRSEKIEELKAIIETLDVHQLDALLVLLQQKPMKEYKFTDHEMLLVEESFARYERKESGGMSAEESVRKLTEHLNTIRKQK